MALHKYLKPIEFPLGADTFVTIDPATKFGFVGTAEGEVERVEGIPHILATVYDWQAAHVDEDAVIVKVLCQAAEASPFKMPSPAAVQLMMWTKFRGMVALLINPSMAGKFRMPVGPDIVKHDDVPDDRVIVLGQAHEVGIYIKQGYRRNVLAHNKRGMTSIQFYTV